MRQGWCWGVYPDGCVHEATLRGGSGGKGCRISPVQLKTKMLMLLLTSVLDSSNSVPNSAACHPMQQADVLLL